MQLRVIIEITLRTLLSVLVAALVFTALGCGPDPSKLQIRAEDGTDLPLHGISDALLARFKEGDVDFDFTFRASDGLGPVYIRASCGSCHEAAAKGPGTVQKMAIVGPDGVTPTEDQSALPWGHTVKPYYTGGATQGIVPPTGQSNLLLSLRMGVPVFGRGYLEAIADSEIERVETEQAARGDGIHGRVHRVPYQSAANPDQPYHHHQPGDVNLIGRFGLKARLASIDEFTADAAQGDMGITSPMRPSEPANPDGLTDDAHPGTDIGLDRVNAIADYMRLLEIPRRATPSERGPALFAQAQCSVCHVPSLKTRSDYPIAALAGIEAPVYTDLLLHDMGDGLADGQLDVGATSREWRTAPLIGLRHLRAYLHDGRAPGIESAILAHRSPGSEANASVQRFLELGDADRAALIEFVQSL